MKDFNKLIEKYILDDNGTTFDNLGKEHAALVLSAFYKHANYIQMYTHSLAGGKNGISEDKEYQESLDLFLNKNDSKMNLFIKEIPNPLSTAFNKIKGQAQKFPHRFAIYKIESDFEENVKSNLSPTGNLIYFTIADGKMFRVEADRNLHSASCSVNDPSVVKIIDHFLKVNESNHKRVY